MGRRKDNSRLHQSSPSMLILSHHYFYNLIISIIITLSNRAVKIRDKCILTEVVRLFNTALIHLAIIVIYDGIQLNTSFFA